MIIKSYKFIEYEITYNFFFFWNKKFVTLVIKVAKEMVEILNPYPLLKVKLEIEYNFMI